MKFAAFALLIQQCLSHQLFATDSFSQVDADASLPLLEAKRSHPVVQYKYKNYDEMAHYDLNDAVEDTDISHMTQADKDSFFLYKGFIDQAIKLAEDKIELLNDADMQFENRWEKNFKGTGHLIAWPIRRIMKI